MVEMPKNPANKKAKVMPKKLGPQKSMPQKSTPGKSAPNTKSDALPSAETRCAFIAILGAPNAGKSTLLNQLVGETLSITSPKVQTTRQRVRGIVQQDQVQIIFTDTPGIFSPRRDLDKAMVEAAWRGAAEADFRLLLIDASKARDGVPDAESQAVLTGLQERSLTCHVALNKIDTVRREALLPLAAAVQASHVALSIYMISALKRDGVQSLLNDFCTLAPLGPWHFPADQLSDVTDRDLAAEITREQLYRQLRQELPYASAVETEKYEERADGSVAIWQNILVSRESQKPIVLGQGGMQLKSIGQAARQRLTTLLGVRVHLFLRVVVRERWDERPELLAQILE